MAKKVNIKELARRYTTAVFELAKSENALDKVSKDLEALEALLGDNPELEQLIASPVLSEAEQVETISQLAKAQKFNSLTLNFLSIVARNGRLQYLRQIVTAFRDKIAEENGEIKAEITTAQELSAAQISAIAKDLGAKTGKTVVVIQNVRPEIIGGLIVKIGPKMFDYSIKSRLTKLKNKLKEAS